jgi:hypothetical protein
LNRLPRDHRLNRLLLDNRFPLHLANLRDKGNTTHRISCRDCKAKGLAEFARMFCLIKCKRLLPVHNCWQATVYRRSIAVPCRA